MREIKFRGKRLANGEWVYGGIDFFDNSVGIFEYDTDNAYEVDPETVGQYTGLRDKKGKKIFEGDIVYDDEIFMSNYKVFYVEKEAGFYGLKIGDRDNNILNLAQLSDCGTIIGNIYENSELLGGE